MKTLLTLIIGIGLFCSSLAVQASDSSAATSLITRALHVDSKVLNQVRSLGKAKPDETSQDLLLRYFKTQKLEFKKPAYLKFEDKSGKLTVHATAEDLDKVERLISKLDEKD